MIAADEPQHNQTHPDMSKPELQFVDSSPSRTAAVSVPFEADSSDVPLAPLPADAGIFQRISHNYLRLKQYKDTKLKSLRPWREFFDRSQFSVPGKLEALSRISDNMMYFHSNYLVLTVVLSSYILITNFWFMACMLGCFAAYCWIKIKASNNENVSIFGHELSGTQAYTALAFLALFLFYVTNGSSTVFWLVTTGLIVVVGHATTRRPVGASQASALQFV